MFFDGLGRDELEGSIERWRFNGRGFRFIRLVGLAPVTREAIIMRRTEIQLMSMENGGKPRHDPKTQYQQEDSQPGKTGFYIFSQNSHATIMGKLGF
jgi:hypothetical protein